MFKDLQEKFVGKIEEADEMHPKPEEPENNLVVKIEETEELQPPVDSDNGKQRSLTLC